ncbi:MAG: 4Fe-4S binding protein [Coriobacteriales bacterium]
MEIQWSLVLFTAISGIGACSFAAACLQALLKKGEMPTKLECVVGACGVCVDACPYGALSFDAQRRPVVDAALCNGCGACEAVCPAGVLTSFSGSGYRGIEVVTEQRIEKTGVLQ